MATLPAAVSSTDRIDSWWPLIEPVVQRWIANNFWSPMSDFVIAEITRRGGPGTAADYWRRDADGERFLPTAAVSWLVAQPDTSALRMMREPDPRAAYFRRTWPRR